MNSIKNEEKEFVGQVISDENSPTFDLFKFRANSNIFVYPGSIVATNIDGGSFLIGRVINSYEINPHESASRSKVREAMGIDADYPKEEMSTNIYRLYEVDIIEEAFIEDEKIEIREPLNMASSGSDVFIPSSEVISTAIGFKSKLEGSINLGYLNLNDDKHQIDVNLEPKFIQRHIFIGGTTGSGKSYATGILLEELAHLKIPIIIIDSQNEYEGLATGLGGTILKPGKDYTVRLSSLTEGEVIDLVPTIQNTLGQGLLAYSFIRLKRNLNADDPEAGFGVDELVDAMVKNAPELEIKSSSLNLATQRTRSYLDRHKFLGDSTNWISLIKEFPIINVNCGNIDQIQLQLVVAATLRELQYLRKQEVFPPYLIVLDEAHLLVPERDNTACKQVIRENVRIGRHYGICMLLITQSPVDIDKKTIRQCNTRFIFALEPDQLEAIRGVKADATEDMIQRLPKMPVGTCILSGTYETIKHAVPIKIKSERKTPEGGASPDIFLEMEKFERKWE